MKKFKIVKADEYLQKRGYKYNVQVLIDGWYCGVGRFCKDEKEVLEYINNNKF